MNHFFLARIGGSDFDTIMNYKYYKTDSDYINGINRVSNLNGYFDKSDNLNIRKTNFINYCKIYI
uniref:Uncharacterized protein n=1 Tax=viral metagenome TaxID=1070528 RepID=A0A6C0IHR3_9ZZZZ